MRIRVMAHPGGQGSDERVRRREPLTFGVPLPVGAVRDDWTWSCRNDELRSAQVRVLDRWRDGSIRWALVDVQADLTGQDGQELELVVQRPADAGYPMDDKSHPHEESELSGIPVFSEEPRISLTETVANVVVDTGGARFHLRVGGRAPFDRVEVGGTSVLGEDGGLTITDAAGRVHAPEIRSVEVEERGPLRCVVLVRGRIGSGHNEFALTLRAHFFVGQSTVRLLITLTNPNRARHAGGFWDLGDRGSILIEDASIAFPLAVSMGDIEVWGSPEVGAPWAKFAVPFELYQDSSGGENWQSPNHLNRERKVANTFRGYRLKSGDRAATGLRATPILALARGAIGVAVAVPHFWQNFPRAVESDGTSLIIRLFPRQYADLHEVQGGEQKTHELFVAFSPDAVTRTPLTWCRERTIAGASPDWSVASKAVPFLAPLDPDHQALINAAIDGPDRFKIKREKVDEYGWRHFGEIYGDHEGIRHKGATPLVSHYNNQYDPVAGFGYQFLRTGDPKWWSLMTELASHLIDIDLYHTSRDKSAYNHGMFWHTYHYGDADTSTHRTFPRAGKGKIHGGGPSAGHNYTSGLLLHYFLTGDEASRAAVVQLAQYVIDLDDGRLTVFRWLDRGSTGHAALSASNYYGPGRGPANSLNALIDGHRLTGDQRFLQKAEELVRRVIHPEEDIELRHLDVPEQRWFYTMFLQSLGKYVDTKGELGEVDAMYAYGQASLLHYAAWMAKNEHPYLEKPEKLEFPTETWAAQDIRKSDVFSLAAVYASGEERLLFAERSSFFHRYAVTTLARMPTRTLARPIVVLTTSGHIREWFNRQATPAAPVPASATRFGSPEPFVPQRTRAEKRALWLGAAGAVVALAALWLTWSR